MNTHIIRSSPPHEVIKHLKTVQEHWSDEDITREYLRLIESGSVPPSSFGFWIGMLRSPHALLLALRQTVSIGARRLAIKKLKKLLSIPEWHETWDAIGGTSGALELFSDFSVREMKQACRAIVLSTKTNNVDSKREKFTELFRALLPSYFPDIPPGSLRTKDPRQLRGLYRTLLPACTKDVVTRLITEHPEEFKAFERQLLFCHTDTVKDLAMQHDFGKSFDETVWLVPLLSEYPPLRTSTRGISRSMHFSIQVLEKLACEDREASFSPKEFMRTLVEPLLKRASKKKADVAAVQNIVNLVLQCMQRKPELAEYLDLREGRLVHMVVTFWGRNRDMFEAQLKALLSMPRFPRKSNIDIVHTIRPFLGNIPRPRRYELLQLCCKTISGLDLDVDDDLKKLSLGPLNRELLKQITPKEALRFFTRVRSARGEENFVTQGPPGSITSHRLTFDNHNGDPDLWHAVLLLQCDQQKEAEIISARGFESCKKAAMSSPSQEKRAFYAHGAICYATASGSLELYKEAHLWARRFVRDPLTPSKLYGSRLIEANALLSGIPTVFQDHVTADGIRHRVEEANQMIMILYETRCSALREPSFNRGSWTSIFQLFFDVVEERRQRSAILKKKLSLSDEGLYEILWSDTLKMLIAAEEKGQTPGFEGLKTNSVRGLMSHSPVILRNEEISTLRFFDNLARARDELWRKYRLSTYPATAALPEPFPRGLPLQHLIAPYEIHARDMHICVPYIASRIDAAVFPDPAAALAPFPTDQEILDAIGPFLDNYRTALKMMVPGSYENVEKERLLRKAWDYAIGPLSQARFTPKEAYIYWSKIHYSDSSSKFWPKFYEFMSDIDPWPTVPNVDQPDEIEEWNPFPPHKWSIPSRKIDELTYIDMSKDFGGSSSDATLGSTLTLIHPQVPEIVEPGIWTLGRVDLAKRRPAIREGQILSALLYLESKIPGSRVFNKPFPADGQGSGFRFPAAFLDDQFYTEKSIDENSSLSILGNHLLDVPPTLLVRLAEQALQSGEPHGVERLALRLIEMLMTCDRPTVASKLAIKAILERPDNSSWHRSLLSPRFFRRVPASVAQDVMNAFAEAILQRLEEQSAATRKAESQDGKPKQRESYVKVTTVKLLATLLKDTECISEEFASTVLARIMVKARHVDIRRSVVESLISLLQDASPEQATKVVSVFETIIPVCRNLRERVPVGEEEWTAAEACLDLPALDPTNEPNDTAPILSSLLRAGHAECTTRIVLPIVANLQQQTARWVALFLRKHGLDDTAQHALAIPLLPREQEIYHALLAHNVSDTPVSLLTSYLDYLVFNIAPPAPIAALNKKLTQDVKLKSQADVQAWLARYAQGADVVHGGLPQTYSSRSFSILDLLRAPGALTGAITPKAVQEHFLKLFTTLLWHEDERHALLASVTNRLWDAVPSSALSAQWATYKQPVVEAMIRYTDALRTRAWERDARRKPAVLPETYAWRLWVLQCAARHGEHPGESQSDAGSKDNSDGEARCGAFAARVARMAGQLAGGVYHRKFAQLKRALDYVEGDDRLRVACHLGDVSRTRLSWLTREDHLRVELAAGLLKPPEDEWIFPEPCKDEELLGKVEAMKESWKASESEEVRRHGFDCW